MSKRKLIRVFTLVLSLVMMVMVFAPYTMAFIDDETIPVINTFTTRDIESSDLILKKTVVHPFGEDYVIPENIAFDFKLEFGGYYAKYYFETTYGRIQADESGSITLSVRPGIPVGVSGIDDGTLVTVTELEKENDGFTLDGEAARQVTVAADSAAVVEYTNIYKPAKVQPTNVKVTGTKTLTGRDWQSGDAFTFKLEMKKPEGWVQLGTKTIEYSANNKEFNQFDFNDLIGKLSFAEIGTYQFRVTELIGSAEGLTYDRTVNPFAITVTDLDMDGKLDITGVAGTENAKASVNGAEFAVHISFSNVYTPKPVIIPDDIVVPVTVTKTVKNTGKETMSPEGFSFLLENTDTGEKITRKTDANGNTVFSLGFSAADVDKTYSYKLTEVNDGKANVTYSAAVYNFRISLKLGDDHQLAATITVDGKPVESLAAAFENIYGPGAGADSPDTGDHSNLQLYIAMSAASAAAIALLLVFRKKWQYFLG